MHLTDRHVEDLSLYSLLATIAATGIHHVFRLGPMLIMPSVLALLVPIALLLLWRRSGSRGLLTAYAVFAAMIVLWFGVLDGFLDHAIKAMGLQNLTFLPGSDAPVVATFYSLGSQATTSWFYEATGVLTAALCVPVLGFTTLLLLRRIGPRSREA
jgi:hypothetical protein